MPALKHIHKYIRRVVGENHKVYVCQLPNCTHKLLPTEVVGKKSICWICGEEMVIWKHPKNGIPVKPRHEECKRKKDKSHIKPIKDVNPLAIIDDLVEAE